MSDPHGRQCVGDLVQDLDERLFHVGRLDADTDGLLLMTNDGELAQRLGHPSHEVNKTYVARVQGRVDKGTLQRIKNGVIIEDRVVDVEKIAMLDQSADASLIELTIHEGRNRIIRRLCEEVGHPVIDLARTSIGPIQLGNLKPGQTRELTRDELGRLYSAVGM
jgi:23S rRNA pseudouridine2605 synthase